VVDSPGRIVIMTTNHPEKLDPALIRPGRINVSLKLGCMKSAALVQLIQHIMQVELSPVHRLLAADLAEKDYLTAAMVEQSCVEADSVDKVFEKLCSLTGCSNHLVHSPSVECLPVEPLGTKGTSSNCSFPSLASTVADLPSSDSTRSSSRCSSTDL